MEWNSKSLGQWDWEEHLYFFNAKVSENPKLQSADWSAEADQEINTGMFYPSGVSGCSESELIHASSSRSSKSASINSSSIEDSKISMFTLEGSQDGDSTGKKELSKEEEPVETSPAQEPSSASVGEHLLTLKLGKRLYFEDACTESDSKKPSLSAGKKCKSNGQNLQHPTCQVVGCGLDLSSAKDYHRKHKVCESHAKSPKVVIAGFERRFCQQCSRFHGLSEFDDKKRSCRRRLSDHNARRRKPHPEALRSNTSALSSSPYEGRQLVNPFAYSRTATNLAWQNIHNSKLPQTKDFLMKPAKAFDKIPSLVTMLSNDSSGLLTSKGIATKSFVTGIEDPITSSDPNATQDVNRALSLLSTNSSWGAAYETKSFTITNSTTHHPMTTHSLSHHRLPFALPEYYNADQQPANSSMCISSYSDCDNSIRFQDSQLWNTPYESGFTSNQLD